MIRVPVHRMLNDFCRSRGIPKDSPWTCAKPYDDFVDSFVNLR
jgi:hypothetical protein